MSHASSWRAYLFIRKSRYRKKRAIKEQLVQLSFDKTTTFENYLKSAKPYISTFLLYLYKCVGHQPDLFEMEIYKFMKNELKLSKKAFKNLNIYLANSASKPIDDTELAIIKNEAAELIEEKSLPF